MQAGRVEGSNLNELTATEKFDVPDLALHEQIQILWQTYYLPYIYFICVSSCFT